MYSSHYAQAYYSQFNQYNQHQNLPQLQHQQPIHVPPTQTQTQRPINHGPWYQPGSVRCTHNGCTFIGSRKSVEIHMMDRHLIFPPGWNDRQRKPQWDADPSLNNGKPVPIFGTSVILDTPEAIDDWIAERKRRFPTAARVSEKQTKLEEATARGQIIPQNPGLRGVKRQRENDTSRRGGGSGRGAGRGRFRTQGGATHNTSAPMNHPLPMKPVAGPSREGRRPVRPPSPSSDSDSDEAPQQVSSKLPVLVQPNELQSDLPRESANDVVITSQLAEPAKTEERTQQSTKSYPSTKPKEPSRHRNLNPRPAPQNPFANKSSLLRNLLLPEIRTTISNLSQAIHFLVENDFLDSVELKPGEASQRVIEVIEYDTSAGVATDRI